MKFEADKMIDGLDKSLVQDTEFERVNAYTLEEINGFSLEMRCCYFLMPFNKKIAPTTVEEWAAEVGFLLHDGEGCFYEGARKHAIEDANALIGFVKSGGTFDRVPE